jgi:hypothetical protein
MCRRTSRGTRSRPRSKRWSHSQGEQSTGRCRWSNASRHRQSCRGDTQGWCCHTAPQQSSVPRAYEASNAGALEGPGGRHGRSLLLPSGQPQPRRDGVPSPTIEEIDADVAEDDAPRRRERHLALPAPAQPLALEWRGGTENNPQSPKEELPEMRTPQPGQERPRRRERPPFRRKKKKGTRSHNNWQSRKRGIN